MKRYIVLGNVNSSEITNVSVVFVTDYVFKSSEELFDTIKCYFPNYQQHLIDMSAMNDLSLGVYKVGYVSNHKDRTSSSVFIYAKERTLRYEQLDNIHNTITKEVIKFDRIQKLSQLDSK